MVRFQAAKVWGIWGMSQEPAAFLLDLSSQLLRPTGWSLGFGPRSLFLRLVCPCQVCVARCRMYRQPPKASGRVSLTPKAEARAEAGMTTPKAHKAETGQRVRE